MRAALIAEEERKRAEAEEEAERLAYEAEKDAEEDGEEDGEDQEVPPCRPLLTEGLTIRVINSDPSVLRAWPHLKGPLC